MPSLIDTGGRVDELVDACVHLIGTEGVTALTVRKIAAVVRVSPSSLASHLTNKHRMLDLVTKRVGLQLGRVMDFRTHHDGAAGLVPDERTLPFVRAWLALVELSRADEIVGAGWPSSRMSGEHRSRRRTADGQATSRSRSSRTSPSDCGSRCAPRTGR